MARSSQTRQGGIMKTIIKVALILILAVLLSTKMIIADDHLFTLPVVGDDLYISAAWYYQQGGLHQAIDYASTQGYGMLEGRDIIAAYGGIVVHVTNTIPNNTGTGLGNYVKIDHGSGYEAIYAHMLYNSASVQVNDYVYQGQVIGQVGNTGASTGPHLHFQLLFDGNPIDPYGWYTYPNTPNTYPNCNPDEYYWTHDPPIHPPNNFNSERIFPDDMLVHVLGSPDYYWLQDGLMHGFNCEYPFYTWGLEWSEAVDIITDEFSNYSLGSNIEVMLGACVFDQDYQRWVFDYASDTSPVIVKRKAIDWQSLGYAVDVWIPVSNSFMNGFNEGDELLNNGGDCYPYGAVLQNQNNSSERYVLVKGEDYGFYGQKLKLSLFSDDVYNINYYHHNFNIPVSSSVLSVYSTVPSGCAMIIDGKLIKGSCPEIYYIENGYKRHIIDDVSFTYYGFDYANVHNVSDNNISNFPTGDDIEFIPSGGAQVYYGGELDDGGFDSGIVCYWIFNDWQDVGDFQVTSGNSINGFYKAEVDVFSNVNYYDVELKQLIEVESGELYHCSFWIRSDNQMPITLALQKDTSPWNNYGLWKEITAHNNWAKYQYIFNCTDSDDLARFTFMVGESSGHLCLDCVVFELVGDIFPPENNLLANANFELGHYAPWQTEDHNCVAEYYTDDFESHEGQYSMFIDPNQEGEYYQVQLKQLVDVQYNQTYYLSFWAKAEQNRTITLELCHNGSPWTNYGLWDEISIGTDWALYNIQFIATNSGTPRFSAHFGDQDIGVWLDDIVLSTGIGVDDYNNQLLANTIISQNYPNPFNSETQIKYKVSDASSKLLIYNVKGQMIKSCNLDINDEIIIWNGLDDNDKQVSSGVYFYTVKTKGKTFAFKKMLYLK